MKPTVCHLKWSYEGRDYIGKLDGREVGRLVRDRKKHYIFVFTDKSKGTWGPWGNMPHAMAAIEAMMGAAKK